MRRLAWLLPVTALATLLSSASTVGAVGGTAHRADAAVAQKPNVVVMLLDDAAAADQRYLTGINRSLGSAGLTFTRAVAQNPLCCPARAQLMTGQLSHNNGVLTNDGAYGGLDAMVDRDNTIAAWVHAAGYRTSFIGKYINGYDQYDQFTQDFGADGIPSGWDSWDPTLRGVTDYWHFATFQDCPTVGDTACVDRVFSQPRYTTTVERDKTSALIQRFHAAGAPFFLFDSWVAPHKDAPDAYNTNVYPKAPPQYYRFSDATDFTNLIAHKPSYNEDDMSDKTPDLSNLSRKAHAKDNYVGRVAALRATDEAIEQIVTELKDLGEFDNTLFILTSDNGFLNGEHRLLYKKWEFTESLDVPLIISWPDGGIPVGVTNRSASLVDLPATILAATGAVSRRTSVDGVSLLDSAPLTVQKYAPTPQLIGSGREGATVQDEGWSYEGIEWGPYTWTRHWGRDGASIGDQFYDLATDPYQIRSRPQDPFYRKNIIITMKQYFAQLRGCAGADQCVPPARTPIVAHDVDHDGLWSWYERNYYGTDPRDPDTDGDGYRDGKDRHPLDPTSH